MAWVWADTADRVVMADNAALTLPDGDWTVCCWIKFSSRTGTSVRDLCRYASASGLFEPRIGDASSASHADDIQTLCTDDDGTNVSQNSTSNPFASNTSWTHVLWQRSGTTVTTYINGSSLFSNGNANFDAIDGGSWKFGNNIYDSVPFKGSMAEWAKWDRALNSTEISNLSNATLAYSPNYYGTNLAWYVPMYSGDYTEKIVGISVTNTGTDGGTHPPVAYPLAAPLITNTPTFFAPAFATAVEQTVTAPLLTNTPTIDGPTFAATYSVTAPLITNTPTFSGPTFVPGSVNLSPDLFTNTATFPSPTLAATYSVTTPLLTNTPAFYGPAFAATYALTSPLITNTPTFYGPTVLPGSVSVTAPLLSNMATFPTPTFLPGSVNLAPALFTNMPTFYGVNITGAQDITAPLLSNSPTLYGPSIRYKWIDVNNVTTGEWTDGDFPFHEI